MQLRAEGRWADASEEMERWLHQSRQMSEQSMVNDRATSSASPRMGKLRAPISLALKRNKSSIGVLSEEEVTKTLREARVRTCPCAHTPNFEVCPCASAQLAPKVQAILEKKGYSEPIIYISFVKKRNEHGKARPSRPPRQSRHANAGRLAGAIAPALRDLRGDLQPVQIGEGDQTAHPNTGRRLGDGQ